jgi:hypothetical protein
MLGGGTTEEVVESFQGCASSTRFVWHRGANCRDQIGFTACMAATSHGKPVLAGRIERDFPGPGARRRECGTGPPFAKRS